MSQSENDPSANTQAFKAWVDQQNTQPAPASASRMPFIIAVVVAVVVVLAIVAWLAL